MGASLNTALHIKFFKRPSLLRRCMLALLCGNKNAGLFGRPPRLSGFLEITPPLSSLRSFRSNELMATCLFLKFCVYSETCTVEACKKRWLQEHSSSPWVAYLFCHFSLYSALRLSNHTRFMISSHCFNQTCWLFVSMIMKEVISTHSWS